MRNKILMTALLIGSSSVAACGEPEIIVPYGQAYIEHRPDGWQTQDGIDAAADCRSKLMEELTPSPRIISGDPSFTDQSFGSPTNIVVGGSAIAYGESMLTDRRQVTYLCEINDPLGERMVSVEALP